MTDLVRAMLWRRVDQPGTEAMELRAGADSWHLYGLAALGLEGQPTQVRYHVACDLGWRTRSVDVGVKWGGDIRVLHLSNKGGTWRAKASPQVRDELASVGSSIDVDLGMTPSTNTLPIRRLELAKGQSAELIAVWVRFPELTVEPLRQRYSRLEERRYRYESLDSGFSADLEVDELGLVTSYSGLWDRAVSFDP